MKQIYHLHITVTEDTKEITDKTYFHVTEYGYHSTLENVKNVIINQMNEIKKDMEKYPEFVQSIYCAGIEIDIDFPKDYPMLFFNVSGDMIKQLSFNVVEEVKNPIFKVGDFVSKLQKGKVEVGVICAMPLESDNTYTIYYDEEFYHNHFEEEYLCKVNVTDDELRKKLNLILKKVLSNKEYQLLKRKDKLKNILK